MASSHQQRHMRSTSIQDQSTKGGEDRLPPLNRSTIKYQFNMEGQDICNHHGFCSHMYEFNDQSSILNELSQPFSHFNGFQLPPAKDVDHEVTPIAAHNSSSSTVNARQKSTNAQKNRENMSMHGSSSATNGKRNSVNNNNNNGSNSNTNQNSNNNNNGASRVSNSLNTVNRLGITEEALDDWIAQSQNRPIISFLDPYKKFKVPDKLLVDFRQRYKKWLKTKERDFEKKLLYFEDRKNLSQVPHHQLPTRRPREAEKNITFRFRELQPHNISGTSIAVRENIQWKTIQSNIHSIDGSMSNQMGGGGGIHDSPGGGGYARNNRNPLGKFDPNKSRSHSPQSKNNNNSNNSDHLTLKLSSQIQQRARSTKSYAGGASSLAAPTGPAYEQDLPEISLINKNVNRSMSSHIKNSNHISFNLNNETRTELSPPNSRSPSPNNDRQQYQQQSMTSDKFYAAHHHLIPKIEMLLKEEDRFGRAKNALAAAAAASQSTSPKTSNLSSQQFILSSPTKGSSSSPQSQQALLNSPKGTSTNLSLLQPTVSLNSQIRISFDRHVDCCLDVNNTEKNQMSDVEFSFWKAVRRIQKKSYIQSITCLKETLNYNKLHLKSIFNLGCLYEYIGMYETSKKWFEIATKFSNNEFTTQIQYGFAICNYHLNNFETCYEHINQVISSIQEPKGEYLYLRAICLKKMERLEEAANDYKQFIQYTCPSNFNMLMHLMFAMIFKNKRDLEVKVEPLVICDFNSLTTQIVASSLFVPALQPYWGDDQQWIDAALLIKRMRLLSFFNRFDENDLKKVVANMVFNIVPKRKIVFPKSNEVVVIAAGTILVQDHISKLEQPDIISYYGEGDIIGFEEKDNNLCQIPDIWFATQTEVETLTFPKPLFVELWKKQSMNLVKMSILNAIKGIPLFAGISELSLYRLAFELIEVVSFTKGEVIFNDGDSAESVKYIQLQKIEHKANKVTERMNQKMTKHEFTKRKINGFYIIKSGVCELETPDGWLEYKLNENDYFGENLMFQTLSIARFGRIKPKSDIVECYFLSRNYFEKITLLDKKIMQNNSHKSPKFKEYQKLLVQHYKQTK